MQLQEKAKNEPNNTTNGHVKTFSLFIQYHGFFNQLCEIHQTISIRDLLVRV